MNTLVLSSSLSPTSRSYLLAKAVVPLLEQKGVIVTFVDARNLVLAAHHQPVSPGMKKLTEQLSAADNVVIAMGVHLYSVSDSLKMLLDTCFDAAKMEGKFFGVLSAAGGPRSFLATMHLSQMCMNEWNMIQMPFTVQATKANFNGDSLTNETIKECLVRFADEFYTIGKKLLS